MENSKKICSTIILMLMVVNATLAQVYYTVNDTDEVEINATTKPAHLDAFLKENKASAIDFNTNKKSKYPFRLKNRQNNWALFDADLNELILKKEAKKYSFQFPSEIEEKSYFTWANKQDKKYFVNLYNYAVETKFGFDNVKVFTKKDSIEINLNIYDVFTVIDKIAVKNNNKWGLIEVRPFETKTFYLTQNFIYDTPNKVPAATNFYIEQLQMLEKIRKKYKLDKIYALDENGYYLVGRHKKTNLVGLYVGEGEVMYSIPNKYDSIIRHKNPETFEVWKNNKVGYYNGNFEIVLKPDFDDFKFVHLDYTFGCAVKKDGKWELFDASEPEKLVEAKAESIPELIHFWLNR